MESVRVFKKSATMFFLGFPLIIISIVAFIGIATTNIGLLWLTAGHAIIVPSLVIGLRLFTSIFGYDIAYVPSNDISLLVPSAISSNAYINASPSYWIAHLTFFCTYIISNAVSVYNLDPILSSTNYQYKVDHRKTRASMIILVASLILISFVGLRWYTTNVETTLGIVIGLVVFGFMGYFWSLAAANGLDGATGTAARNSDIFGVVNQMVPTNDSDLTICTKSTPAAKPAK
jgi:hypothetical protein